jgi:hypothetical protein
MAQLADDYNKDFGNGEIKVSFERFKTKQTK